MTPESYNTTMGVVRTINEKLTSTHNLFICEMGAKYVGDIKEICEILGEIIGESYDDKLIDTLFSNFCLGK